MATQHSPGKKPVKGPAGGATESVTLASGKVVVKQLPAIEITAKPTGKRGRKANTKGTKERTPGLERYSAEQSRLASDRRQMVWELKCRYRLSNKEIAQRLGCSEPTVSLDLKTAMEEAKQKRQDMADGYLDEQLDLLEGMLRGVAKEASDGGLFHIDRALAIHARICKLVGIEAKPESDNTLTVKIEESDNWRKSPNADTGGNGKAD